MWHQVSSNIFQFLFVFRFTLYHNLVRILGACPHLPVYGGSRSPKSRCNYNYKITWGYVQENRSLQVKLPLHNTVDRFSNKMQEDKTGFGL